MNFPDYSLAFPRGCGMLIGQTQQKELPTMSNALLNSLRFCKVRSTGDRTIEITREGGFTQVQIERILQALSAKSEVRLAEDLCKQYTEALFRLFTAEAFAFACKDYKRKNLDAWFKKHCEAVGVPFSFTDSTTYGARGYHNGGGISFRYGSGDCASVYTYEGRFGYNTTLDKAREDPEDTVGRALGAVCRIEKAIEHAVDAVNLRNEARAKVKAIEEEYEAKRKEIFPTHCRDLSLSR